MPLALGFVSVAFIWLALAVVLVGLGLSAVDAIATPRPASIPVTRLADPQLSIGVEIGRAHV